MTNREKNAIETAHLIANKIVAEHGDTTDKMMFIYAMQYPQWGWVTEDLGLARARKELVES